MLPHWMTQPTSSADMVAMTVLIIGTVISLCWLVAAIWPKREKDGIEW